MSHLIRGILKQWPIWTPIFLGVMCIVSATVLHRPIVILNRLVAERIFVSRPRRNRTGPATWFSETVVQKSDDVPAHYRLRAAFVICGTGIVLWRICSVLFTR